MNLNDINTETTQYLANKDNRTGWLSVLNDFNMDEMIGKYGPEGCFILAYALRDAAQNDMDMAMREAEKDIEDGMLLDAKTRFGILCC